MHLKLQYTNRAGGYGTQWEGWVVHCRALVFLDLNVCVYVCMYVCMYYM